MEAYGLPAALRAAEHLLGSYGYLAILGGVILEDFGLFVPGETLLVVGAADAGTGGLNILGVLVAGFVGAVVGDSIGFAIGRFGGRPLLVRFGRYVFLTPARLDRLEDVFVRHGGKVVIVARFIDGLRQFGGIVAGASGMSWARFRLFNVVGAVLWVSVWGGLGYGAGTHLNAIDRLVSRSGAYLALSVAAIVGVSVVVRVVRRRSGHSPRPRRKKSRTVRT